MFRQDRVTLGAVVLRPAASMQATRTFQASGSLTHQPLDRAYYASLSGRRSRTGASSSRSRSRDGRSPSRGPRNSPRTGRSPSRGPRNSRALDARHRRGVDGRLRRAFAVGRGRSPNQAAAHRGTQVRTVAELRTRAVAEVRTSRRGTAGRPVPVRDFSEAAALSISSAEFAVLVEIDGLHQGGRNSEVVHRDALAVRALLFTTLFPTRAIRVSTLLRWSPSRRTSRSRTRSRSGSPRRPSSRAFAVAPVLSRPPAPRRPSSRPPGPPTAFFPLSGGRSPCSCSAGSSSGPVGRPHTAAPASTNHRQPAS